MSTLSRELSLDEQLEVAELLAESGPRTLLFARGVFAAAATSPRELDPTEWLPLVLGDQIPDAARLKRILALLMRDAAHVRAQLEERIDPTPESEDEEVVRQYCRGYVQVAQRDGRWTSRQDAFEWTLPLLVLSDYARPETLESLRPEAVTNPGAFRERCRAELGASVLALHRLFAPERAEAARARESMSETKTGRNEPCPCGSGKKYKKCCGG